MACIRIVVFIDFQGVHVLHPSAGVASRLKGLRVSPRTHWRHCNGYPRHEIIGQTPRLLGSGAHSAEFYREFWATIQSGEVFRGRITNRRKCGDIYCAEQTVTPMLDPGGKITHFVSVNAGHVPGYVLDAKGNVRKILESPDLPPGLFSKAAFATSGRIKLRPGEILALFTDGLLEAEGPDHSEFGTRRTLEVIRARRHEPARSITAAIYAAVEEHSHGRPQADDIAVVICRSV